MEKEKRDVYAEFERAQRRGLKANIAHGFVKTYKPVLDDGRRRSFDTMAQYRAWCEESLPPWLGYGRAPDGEDE